MKTKTYIKQLHYVVMGVFFMIFSFQADAQIENQPTLEYPTAEKDLNTAKATVKAYENGNWEELRSFLKDDARIYGLGNFDSLSADETIQYWTKGRETAEPALMEGGTWLGVSIEEGPRTGNWVYHWGTNTLTYRNGETISFPYHVALKIEDDKVAESHFYYDNMKIIREMGYAISPPLEDTQEEELDFIDHQ